MTAAARKRNIELPGLERPVVDDLEAIAAAFLEAREDKRRARDDEAEARAVATEKLIELADVLEKDAHGNPTYIYRDGTRAFALKLATSTKLSVEVLDDGTGADEAIG